jgi:UDP-N-acetylmuramoyl-tripeptide--D-alanyl-D-alanine ligase
MSTIVRHLGAFYGFTAPRRLVALYVQAGGPWRYFGRYWTTQDFTKLPVEISGDYRVIARLLGVGMLCQLLAGLALLYEGIVNDRVGMGYFGAAVVLAYPIVWALLLFLAAFGWRLGHPKRFGKDVLASMLEKRVRILRTNNEFVLISVAGSVGKTSTKLAIAKVLAASGKRVCYQEGNYNDRLTVPLIFFNETEPNIYNVGAWLKLLWRTNRKAQNVYPYDVVVVELGTDGPGQMAQFAYLHPELSVVTAVAEEHMEYFKTLDAVAKEELTVFDYSTRVLVNADDVAKEYLGYDTYESYGVESGDYKVKRAGKITDAGQKLTIQKGSKKLTFQSHFLGVQGAKILLAAATVADLLNIEWSALKDVLQDLQPFAGRMQLLPGIKKSTLIDDTYNASPSAVLAALDVLYSMDTTQRIAILGSMNELGEVSPSAHAQVGTYCDPKKLDLVVTLGQDAKDHLAPAAKEGGCEVHSYLDAKEAGNFVKSKLKNHAIVLAKGSQNGVFAEEALKPLLEHKDYEARLVRQSPYWLSVKQLQD